MLYHNPPHTCSHFAPAGHTRDSAGGTTLTYPGSATQADVPCSINTAGASEVERYAQDGIVVTHTVAFLGRVLTSALVRGSKLTSGSSSFHVRGIRTGRAYGGVPAFTYADCEEVLG